MRRFSPLYIVLVLVLYCSGQPPLQRTISLPTPLYTVITAVMHQEKVAVYVRLNDIPADWRDCVDRTAVICGDFADSDLMTLLDAGFSLTGRPLFSFVHQYRIHPSLSEGYMSVSQDMTITGSNGVTTTITRQLESVGYTVTADSLLELCKHSLPTDESVLIFLPAKAKAAAGDLVRLSFSPYPAEKDPSKMPIR